MVEVSVINRNSWIGEGRVDRNPVIRVNGAPMVTEKLGKERWIRGTWLANDWLVLDGVVPYRSGYESKLEIPPTNVRLNGENPMYMRMGPSHVLEIRQIQETVG